MWMQFALSEPISESQHHKDNGRFLYIDVSLTFYCLFTVNEKIMQKT